MTLQKKCNDTTIRSVMRLQKHRNDTTKEV